MPEDNTEKDLNKTLDTIEKSLSELSSHLKPFQQMPMNELVQSLTPIERAKFEVLLCYATNSLFYMYLTTQGVSPNDHPVKQELDRIRSYIKKVKEAEKKQSDSDSHKIDVSTANRFIARSLTTDKADMVRSSDSDDSNDEEIERSPKHSDKKKKKQKSSSKKDKEVDISRPLHNYKITKHSKKHKKEKKRS